jgi:hypothetical protein
MTEPGNINDELEEVPGANDITALEKELLDKAAGETETNELQLKRAQLDNTDNEGTPLNEKGGTEDITGGDLDIPGSELDDDNEEIGEEDEENNNYSQADTE